MKKPDSRLAKRALVGGIVGASALAAFLMFRKKENSFGRLGDVISNMGEIFESHHIDEPIPFKKFGKKLHQNEDAVSQVVGWVATCISLWKDLKNQGNDMFNSRKSYAHLFEGLIIGGALATAATFLFGTKKGKELRKEVVHQYKKLGHTTKKMRAKLEQTIREQVQKKGKAVKAKAKRISRKIDHLRKAA